MISHSRRVASLPFAVGIMLLVVSVAIRKRTEVELDAHFNSTGGKCEELYKVSVADAKASGKPLWIPKEVLYRETHCRTTEPSYCVLMMPGEGISPGPGKPIHTPMQSPCYGSKPTGWTCEYVVDAESCDAADYVKSMPEIWMHEYRCICKKDSDIEAHKKYLIKLRKEKAFTDAIGTSALKYQKGIRMLVFDFDKTLAISHVFNLLRNSPQNKFGLCPSGPCSKKTLQQLAGQGFWDTVFGGREDMLRGHFQQMHDRGVSIYVASFGFHDELVAGLEHLGVAQYVPSNHVSGIDTCDGCSSFPEHGSNEKYAPVTPPPSSAKALCTRKKRNPHCYHKGVQIKKWALEGNFKPEEILLVDDDNLNTGDITEGFGHAVYVHARSGVTKNSLDVVEDFRAVPCCVEVTKAAGEGQISWWNIKSETKGEWLQDHFLSAFDTFQRINKCPAGIHGYVPAFPDHHGRWTGCSYPPHGR